MAVRGLRVVDAIDHGRLWASGSMNILFVNNSRGRGGGEEFLRDLLPGLIGKGAKVGLVCRPDTPLAEMFRETGVAVHPIDRSGIHGFTSIFKIAGIIRRDGYQIVNIQRGHDIIQSWLGARVSGATPVLMYTSQVPEFLRSRFLLGRMDAIVTISRHIRDGLLSFEPSLGPKISIVYYGIDLEKFGSVSTERGWLRKRVGRSPEAKIIGTVGDLWKNQIEFLDVLALLRKRFPEVYYAIVGSPRENGPGKEFRSRAETLGLTDAVLWPGRLAKEEMSPFFADIDLAVSTYRNEGFGIWILEAMAMGKPVVAYDAGGIRDSLEGSPCGILVNGGPGEMAEAIGSLLKDEHSYQRMAKAAPRWVREKFGRERMVEEYDAFFRKLLFKIRTSP